MAEHAVLADAAGGQKSTRKTYTTNENLRVMLDSFPRDKVYLRCTNDSPDSVKCISLLSTSCC